MALLRPPCQNQHELLWQSQGRTQFHPQLDLQHGALHARRDLFLLDSWLEHPLVNHCVPHLYGLGPDRGRAERLRPRGSQELPQVVRLHDHLLGNLVPNPVHQECLAWKLADRGQYLFALHLHPLHDHGLPLR